MKGGYVGKMLFVDLSSGGIKEQELSEDMARKFMGGPSLGARVLYDMMKPGVDPLGPDNVIGFVTGPLTGSGASFGSRFTVVCKSPVTGGFNDANSGGFFGAELKKAGYDAVFVSGAAKEPVYLWIQDGKAEIRSADKLWGKDCKETLDLLVEETGEPKLRASVIGPAGENLSLISCPINDGHRAPGRGGPGAVMGSKKFKGIAVRGTGEVPVANKPKLSEVNRGVAAALRGASGMAASLGQSGTLGGTPASALSGDSPVKNWDGVGIVDFGEENANRIGAEALDPKYKVKKYACANCPLGCGAVYKVGDGRWPMEETERPEYETAAAFGCLCLNGDAAAMMKCNDICNRAGLDTISAGGTVAWVLECYEKGALTKSDLDGIDATWGNGEAIVALTEKIASGEGCGKYLKLGSAGAAKAFGKGGEYVQASGGIELPMHDPRFAPGLARTYAYDPTPGRHVKGGLMPAQVFDPAGVYTKYTYEGTGFLDELLTCNAESTNASGLCLFAPLGMPGDQAPYIEAVTGWKFKGHEWTQVGMRSFLMRQAFNVREGLRPKDFAIPPRSVGEPPQKVGPVADVTVDHKLLARNFFSMAGIDPETGKPARGALEKLGLEDVAKDLHG